MSLHLTVAEAIVARRLWAPGEAVVVAVSGGMDSVGLLELLVASRGVHRGALSVRTIDHGQRSRSADDAAFVAELAARHGLPCEVARLALPPGASEAAMRRARYAALEAGAVDVVALAHHREDQAETALLGWLRGSGTRGMAGMAWRVGRRVRPLLATPRADVRAWLVARGVGWREDPSNDDPRFLRNRVRRELLPLAEALRRGAVEGLARGAGLAAEDDALLETLSAAAEQRDGPWLRAAWVADGPSPLVRRALLRDWPEATAAQLDALVVAARRGGGAVTLSRGVMVLVDGHGVRTVEAPGLPS
jgi:tRNA(Ile)-lysidine synthase